MSACGAPAEMLRALRRVRTMPVTSMGPGLRGNHVPQTSRELLILRPTVLWILPQLASPTS